LLETSSLCAPDDWTVLKFRMWQL